MNEPTTYTTVLGDMWDDIARKTVGDSKYKNAIMRENPAYIDVYMFSGGIELTIPALDESDFDATVPPWKQVSG